MSHSLWHFSFVHVFICSCYSLALISLFSALFKLVICLFIVLLIVLSYDYVSLGCAYMPKFRYCMSSLSCVLDVFAFARCSWLLVTCDSCCSSYLFMCLREESFVQTLYHVYGTLWHHTHCKASAVQFWEQSASMRHSLPQSVSPLLDASEADDRRLRRLCRAPRAPTFPSLGRRRAMATTGSSTSPESSRISPDSSRHLWTQEAANRVEPAVLSKVLPRSRRPFRA